MREDSSCQEARTSSFSFYLSSLQFLIGFAAMNMLFSVLQVMWLALGVSFLNKSKQFGWIQTLTGRCFMHVYMTAVILYTKKVVGKMISTVKLSWGW